MIGYLKGTVVGTKKEAGNRVIFTLEVNSCGYDMQIPARLATQLPPIGEPVQVFTHLQIREEQPVLYAFGSVVERDLFRQLLTVSGIGTASAISLLDTLELPDLVQAIVTGNSQLLIQAPGVGGKTAERISLELRKKLADWRNITGLRVATDSAPISPAILEDVQTTLLALGYSPSEVTQAVQTVSQNSGLSKNASAEDWIRQAIAWLSSQ